MYDNLYVSGCMDYIASMSAERTSIACERDTLEQLRSLKRRGQSYDDLLNQMLESFDREV